MSNQVIKPSLKERLASRKQEIKSKSAGKFIKFDDGDVRILDFVEPLDGEWVPHDFKDGKGPQEKLDFYAYELDPDSNEPMTDTPQSWTTGTRNIEMITDFFADGVTTLRVKKVADGNWRIERYQ
jgi:hypothetical protein